MIKTLFICLSALGALFLPSCAVMDSILGPPRVPDRPLPPTGQERTVTQAPPTQVDAMRGRLGVQPTAPQQGDDAYLGDRGATPPVTQPTAPKPPVAPAAPKKFPYATMAPNRPGFVISPYNGAEIDVRGLKSGTLVRDPADPNPDHKFYVP